MSILRLSERPLLTTQGKDELKLTSKLLDERPVFVLPSLAVNLGLNEAIVLQQLHWALGRDIAQSIDGQRWLKADLDFWRKQFPWWSEMTIRRTFQNLRDRQLVETKRGREGNVYAINYDRFDQLERPSTDQIGASSDHIDASTDQIDRSPCKREERETTREGSAASAAPEAQPEGEQLFDAPPTAPVEPKRESAAKRRAEVPDELVHQVWDHWLKVFDGKVRVKALTVPRERVIRSALLAVGLDVELCKRAIDGLKTYRESHSGDIQPATIFETGPNSISNLTDQIEWWAQHAKSNLPSRNAIRDGDRPEVALDLSDVPSVTRGTIQARRIEVVRMFTQPDASDAKERGEAAVDWLRDHVGHEPHWDGEHLSWHQVKP